MAAEADSSQPEDQEWLVVDFLNTLPLPTTRETYGIYLRQWIAWCDEHRIGVTAAKAEHVESFVDNLRGIGLKDSSIVGKLTTLRTFYAHLERNGKVGSNPTDFVKRPRVPRETTTQTLSKTELLACLAVAETERSQDQLLWRLLALHGLQIGEALSIDVSDISREPDGTMSVSVFHTNSDRTTLAVLDERTAQLAVNVMDGREAGPLFRMRRGQEAGARMDRKAAARVIAHIAKRAGLARNVTPRSLRTTWIRLQQGEGRQRKELLEALGLKDRGTLRRYKPRTSR